MRCDYPRCEVEAEFEIDVRIYSKDECGGFSRSFCETHCFTKILNGTEYNLCTMGEFFDVLSGEPPEGGGIGK